MSNSAVQFGIKVKFIFQNWISKAELSAPTK